MVDQHGIHSNSTWYKATRSQKETQLKHLICGSIMVDADHEVSSNKSRCAANEDSASKTRNCFWFCGCDGDNVRLTDLCKMYKLRQQHPAASPLGLHGLTKGPQIGRGSSGVVWRASTAVHPDAVFAVKEMQLQAGKAGGRRRRSVLNEILLSYRADHPHVVTCYEVRSACIGARRLWGVLLLRFDAQSLDNSSGQRAAEASRFLIRFD